MTILGFKELSDLTQL